MEQRKLYKTLEEAMKGYEEFKTDLELMDYLMKQIISNENIAISGGRVWQLNEDRTAYKMIEQWGEIEKIKKGYELKVSDYPNFYRVGSERTVIASETDKYLSQIGIQLYSATGVGERYKVKDNEGKDQFLFQYILAFNSNELSETLANTLNIISTTVSSMMRSRKIEKRARAIQKELEKAREIQKSILPEHDYRFGNYEIFGLSVPDRIVGGDFYDYLTFGEDRDRLGIAIGDAASKGFSAAAQALYVSGALKMGAENQLKMTAVMKKINNLVYRVFPYERFVTLFYLEIHSDTKGLCQYVNAGHNSPLYLNYTTDKIEALTSTGPVLGPSPNQEYKSDSFYFNQYDILLLYTDGITEAVNSKFEFFGEDRLRQELLNNKHFPAKVVAENIMEAVQKHSARGKYSDDKTLVVVKRIS